MEEFECRYDSCSYSTGTEHGRKIHEGKEHDGSKDRVEIECDECGTIFKEVPSRADRAKYCSEKCRIKNFTEVGIEKGKETRFNEDHEPWNKGLSIEESEKIQEVAVKCSEKMAGWNINPGVGFNSGEDHRDWKEGYEYDKKRGENWTTQRLKALKEYDYTCQLCETTESELDPPLDVHHITPFREFESYEEANKVENLVTLCRSCHAKVERGSETLKSDEDKLEV